jgi:hypothetical protein
MAEAPQIDPGQAREFLTSFGHSPDALKGMQDPDVLKLHGNVTTALQTHAPKFAAFGEKWREALAGEEKDDLNTLGRFQDPKALWQRTKELTTKLSKGELKMVTPFPANGTDQQKAEWRQANGIPEAPEKYDTNLGNNLVIGEEDKPMVESFLKHAHASNINNDVAKSALQWYFGTYMAEQQKELAQADEDYRRETIEALAKDWGPDYKRNMTAVQAFLQRAPEDLRARFMSGRLADGRAIGDDPAMLRWFAEMELAINPHVTLTGPEGANAAKNVDARIKEIEGMMGTDKYVKDEAIQQELRDLYDARARLQERGKVSA